MPTGRFIYLALVLASMAALAQQSNLEPERKTTPEPTVAFTYNFPGRQPEHFFIAVESSGRAAYDSRSAKGGDGAPGEPYSVKFAMSPPTRARIFALTQQANRFQGDFDYKKTRIAFTGTKTLSYTNGVERYETTYNWSQNPAIQQLTDLFLGISFTLETGARLAYLRRFDKLGLDAELKTLDDQVRRGFAQELSAIEPVLRAIASDTAVMHVARQRAESLLAHGATASAQVPAAR